MCWVKETVLNSLERPYIASTEPWCLSAHLLVVVKTKVAHEVKRKHVRGHHNERPIESSKAGQIQCQEWHQCRQEPLTKRRWARLHALDPNAQSHWSPTVFILQVFTAKQWKSLDLKEQKGVYYLSCLAQYRCLPWKSFSNFFLTASFDR